MLNYSPTDRVIKIAVDQAVHSTISRFKDELGEQESLCYRLATNACYTAIEQFKVWMNNELRLIEIYYEQKARELELTPPKHFIKE